MRLFHGLQFIEPQAEPTSAIGHTAERGKPDVGSRTSLPSGELLPGRQCTNSWKTDRAAMPQRLRARGSKKDCRRRSHNKSRGVELLEVWLEIVVRTLLVVVPEPPIQLFGTFGHRTGEEETRRTWLASGAREAKPQRRSGTAGTQGNAQT